MVEQLVQSRTMCCPKGPGHRELQLLHWLPISSQSQGSGFNLQSNSWRKCQRYQKAEFCSASSTNCSSATIQSTKAGMRPRRAIPASWDSVRGTAARAPCPDSGILGLVPYSLPWTQVQVPGHHEIPNPGSLKQREAGALSLCLR